MKILWECSDWPGSRIEPGITDLSWIANGEKTAHGMLGVGSDSGSVGITLTDLTPTNDDQTRYNFNLRGHQAAVTMVHWNNTQTKLASTDAAGVVYVWVKNDDRWSVELVNDRGVKLRDFCWSPCGASALMCYEDNFVLIGTSAGHRMWSNIFPAANAITCGVWSPEEDQLIIGFNSGAIQVLTETGNTVMERSFTADPVHRMACSPKKNGSWTLAILTSTNKILMIEGYEQIDANFYQSPCSIIQMSWSDDGETLAVINQRKELLMLDKQCRCIHRELMQFPGDKPLSALTWAHGGQSVIVAAGGNLAVGRILPGAPSLFNLVTYDLWKNMGETAKRVDRLPLPVRERNALRLLDHHAIRCRIPRAEELMSFVCSVSEARCYCTIRPLARASHSYVLCMEHLGGLVPLLIGRQVNRFLPQFHISLHPSMSNVSPVPLVGGSSAQVEDVSIMPRASNGRNSLWRRSKRQFRALMSRHVRPSRPDLRLLQVTSNLWCTRFSISSMSNRLPDFLGQVVYKTSVLHLQPRQMTIDLALLTPSSPSRRDDKTSKRPSLCPSPANSDDPGVDVDDMTQLLNCSLGSSSGKEEDCGLTKEERAFFDRVVSECTALRTAMCTGALEMTLAQQGATSQVSALKDSPARRVDSRQGDTDLSLSTTSTWHEEIESLDYIDSSDDRDILLPSTSRCSSSAEEQAPSTSSAAVTAAPEPSIACTSVIVPSSTSNISGGVPAPAGLTAFSALGAVTDLQTDIDRLIRVAGSLSNRFNSKRDPASIDKMRSQMKELLRKVNEIEKKVGSDDVRAEVRQLMRTLREIKRALGEGRPPAPKHRVLTMHNKTPFWNEHNQVYQLDFGGRVTQESAKNFQVEMDGKQVLQFGRIDGGAYTLDFRRPFSASQAFAVALASITQRLK